MLKKIISGIACMALALLVGCGGNNNGPDPGNSFAGQTGGNAGNSGSAKGSVYCRDFRPEVDGGKEPVILLPINA